MSSCLPPIARAAAILAFASLANGCATARSFDALGNYTHSRYGYVVPADAVDAAWLLENFAVDSSGRPTEPFDDPRYQYRMAADMDGDGSAEAVVDQPYWDLRYRNRRDAGELWVSTLPLSSALRETELRVLARRYVDAVSGAGIAVVQLGTELQIRERRFATRVLAERPIVVDGFDAFEVVFEVANVDQLQLDANARWQRARVVIVRPGFYWRPPSYGLTVLPVVMTIGYANHPDDYAANEASLDRLVDRILIQDPDLADRSNAILACFPSTQTVSFLATRQTVWSYRAIEFTGVADETDACIAEAVRGFVPRDLGRAKHYVRTVARARPTALPPSVTAATPSSRPNDAPAADSVMDQRE